MPAFPLISHTDPASVIAYRSGQPVCAAQFLEHVASLAQALPQRHHILNLCKDRYHFAVGFAAALVRGQVSLLPPNYTPSFVERLTQQYPDLYCLADAAAEVGELQVMPFPALPEHAQESRAVPQIPAQQLAALVFTSGSTGEPLPHPKYWGGLFLGSLAEAKNLHIKPDSGLALLGTVPPQHMYGLESSLLLAMHNGLALVAERPFYAADIRAQLAALPSPRCLITTPIHLRTLLAEAAGLPELEFVLCATALLAPQLASEAEVRIGAPLYEIYGCTEAGMVASRRTTQGQAWHALPGVELVQDAQGSRARGRHVAGEVLLSDVIELNADGTFILHGRNADMVNIAGKRTSLASLSHHLNQVPGVQDGVFFLPDETADRTQRPLAFVVAPGLVGDDVLAALRRKVDAVFLPRPVYFVDALPRNSTGKLTREALLQLLARCTHA